MVRVGYDADTAKYYFRDREGVHSPITHCIRTSIRLSVMAGVLYSGDEGAEYGEMVRGEYSSSSTSVIVIPFSTVSDASQQEDLEAAPARPDGYQPLAVDQVSPL